MHFDWSQYTGQLKWLPERTIYLTLHGSHAYRTNLPTSDVDIRGIAVAPIHYYLGISETFEQTVQNEPVDLTIFDLLKFVKLAADANPNALEILFTDPSDHLLVSPVMEVLLESRDLFLSQMAKDTFSGYARRQLRRINSHYRWLKNPPQAAPTRAEFGLPERTVIPADQLAAAQSAIRKQVDQWSWHEMEHLDPATRQAVQDEFTRRLLEITQWGWDQVDAKIWLAASRAIGLDENFIRLLDLERQYTARLKEWQQYQDWKKNRNPARAALEAKYGYDCYAADTEFLTDGGWKTFDCIGDSDHLATVFVRAGVDPSADMSHRSFMGIEYQKPTDRFDSLYNGPMYRLSGHHYDCLVTANHRMLFQKEERATGAVSQWCLEEVSALPDTFNVRVSPTPRKTTFSNNCFTGVPVKPSAYLSLMGWYLSDGCAVFDGDGDGHVKGLRVSQKVGGKLSWHMARWHSSYQVPANSSLYQYARAPNSYNPRPHQERILEVRATNVGVRLVQECGFKFAKRIPRYVFGLSRCLMETLLLGLLRGDGTEREHKTRDGSYIYYSKSRELADDVQELAFLAGWETALWGPFQSTDVDGRLNLMYQVHLRRGVASRRFVRSANVERMTVHGQRVVCFSVPNGTLITRRNGKVAIHGNCKHAMHLVRLTKMCRELLTEGVVRVRRPDADELLEIRNGAWSYEELVGYSDRQDAELNELVKTSKLPRQPDLKKLDQLCQTIIQRMM
jgi:predicted nucleotidyltransferase